MLKWLLTYCYCWAVIGCFAQNHSYRQYTTDDGLPTNYVYGVIEDDDGYIWAYTENGISKFDGQHFHNYTTADGLPHNDVVYMQKDKYGTLWCRTLGNTATYVAGDSITYIPFQAGNLTGMSKINALVYYHGLKSLYTFRNGKLLDSISYIPDTLYKKGYWLAPSSDTSYVGYDFERQVYLEYKDKELKSYPMSIKLDLKEHRQWRVTAGIQAFSLMLTNKGLYTTNKTTHISQYYTWQDLLGTNIKQSFAHTNNPNQVVICTEKGTIFLDKRGKAQGVFLPKNISNQYTLHRLFIDSQGNYWQGTREGGLFFISHKVLRTELLQADIAEDVLVEKLFQKDKHIYLSLIHI